MRSFSIQVSILSIILIFVAWDSEIIPFSKNVNIRNKTTELTGTKFWSWKEFAFEEIGIRGEGYTLDVYRFNEETSNYFKDPSIEFFNSFPRKEFADIRWTKTPIRDSEKEILQFMTPTYSVWTGEILSRQEWIRRIAETPGSYYSYKEDGSIDFYIIAPQESLVIMINHNS